jgi:hypothetical protein
MAASLRKPALQLDDLRGHCRDAQQREDWRPSLQRNPAMRLVLWSITLAFGAYTLWLLAEIGYLGIWQAGFATAGSTQVTLDLVISSAPAGPGGPGRC